MVRSQPSHPCFTCTSEGHSSPPCYSPPPQKKHTLVVRGRLLLDKKFRNQNQNQSLQHQCPYHPRMYRLRQPSQAFCFTWSSNQMLLGRHTSKAWKQVLAPHYEVELCGIRLKVHLVQYFVSQNKQQQGLAAVAPSEPGI